MHTSTDPAAVPMTALGQSNATRRIQSLVDSCTTLGLRPPCDHLVRIACVSRSVFSRRMRANWLSSEGASAPPLDSLPPALPLSFSGAAPSEGRPDALEGIIARREVRVGIRRGAPGHRGVIPGLGAVVLISSKWCDTFATPGWHSQRIRLDFLAIPIEST